jgi:hypothetical protein
MAPFDLIPLLYILKYWETNREPPEITFPPLQVSVLPRSHLEAFSGDLPEGESITEGFYINLAAQPMMCE